jgi:hypothetical protein
MTTWPGERCKRCLKPQRLSWLVTDECWERIVPQRYTNKVLCLECFLASADERREPLYEVDFHHLCAVDFSDENLPRPEFWGDFGED